MITGPSPGPRGGTARAVLTNAEATCEAIADDRTEVPDDEKRTPAWSMFVLRGGDCPDADNDRDTVKDSCEDCGIFLIGNNCIG